MSIEARGITKRFGNFVALDAVDLHVRSGELTALLGPSGSGKTTLLRIIAGLEAADRGTVHFDGADVTGLPAGDRRAGFAFQHYALFRHMTVFENIAFGLRIRPRSSRPADPEIRERVLKLLRLIQLEPLGNRYPSQLSGGQQQRVSLARALAVEPRVLLLDEPFGALDAKVRQELRRWLRRLHDEIHLTSLFVTHDQDEALEVSDRVVVMNHGRIEQVGAPDELYENPATPFVYDFLGRVNRFDGRRDDGCPFFERVAFENPGAKVAFVRPHDVRLSRMPASDAGLPARVIRAFGSGPLVHVELFRDNTEEPITAQLTRDEYHRLKVSPGDRVFVELHNVRVFQQGAG